MRKIKQRLTTAVLSAAMLTPTFSVPAAAQENGDEYKIYPTPQSIEYAAGEETLSEEVNVVYGQGIDSYTKAHLEEVFDLLNTRVTVTDGKVQGKTNVLLGIEGTGSAAEVFFDEKNSITAADLFEHTDSYALQVDDGVIAILGKDTDAVFHGLTSLKHIFTQTPDGIIRHLVMEDYANVKTRGFIEGYYGNPWSHEDRMDLMRFGGDYKLNGYIYAPKDDPKHNSNWKGLYTEEELEKHHQLAEAGNESKCYYIYALHPFMYNAIRFNTDANYEEDLNIIKTKFEQLMQVGVKQFAILADDAAVPSYGGASSYVRLMTDLTNWLEEKQSEYEGLKKDMIFCPNDYMGYGSSSQMQTLKQLPASVSIIETGGRVWGEVGPSFNNTFYSNMGRPAFMWINWPCSDNTKDGLIMGGAEAVLKPNVNPDTVDGIVLNPMQQSEPSKQGIFTNADYAWNIWESADQYTQVWNDSFAYIDHGTGFETDGSNAYRELSKHMKNSQQIGNQESEEIKDDLSAFITALNAGTPIADMAADLKQEFTKLHDAAITYRSSTGNERTLSQICYWIDAWEEMTDSINAYLDLAVALENGEDTDTIWDLYAAAKDGKDASESHGFWYIDHTEYANPGRRYIKPFHNNLENILAPKVAVLINPNIEVQTFITNRTDTPTGNLSNAVDGKASTEIIFKTPNSIAVGEYVGMMTSKAQTLKHVVFRLGQSGNANDTFAAAKIQYTLDGVIWNDLNGEIYTLPKEVDADGLNIKGVKGVRMIATSAKSNTWLGVKDIVINPEADGDTEVTVGKTVTLDNLSCRINSTDAITDDNNSTYAHLAEGNYKGDEYQDYIPLNASVTVTYDSPIALGKIHYLQDTGTDRLYKYAIEYSADGTNFTTLQEYNGDAEVNLDVSAQNLTAKAIRVRNLELKIQDGKTAGYWWKLYDFSTGERSAATPKAYLLPTGVGYYSTYNNPARLYDGDLSTYVWTNADIKEGHFFTCDMGAEIPLGTVDIAMGNGTSQDKFVNFVLEYSSDNENWTQVKTLKGTTAGGVDIFKENLDGAMGRYVRIRSTENRQYWCKLSEFNVHEYRPDENFETKHLIASDGIGALTRYTAKESELKTNEAITLQPGEFVGIDTEKIRQIASVEKGTDADLTIQTSRNGLDWNDLPETALPAARYVRLINNTDAAITTKIASLKVTTTEATGPVLYDTTMGINSSWGVAEDTRNNGAAFDGDMDTTTEFGDLPQEGQYIIYDLGQQRTISKIALYSQDSAVNYIRDADILVSEDLENWTKVVTIGDGVENEDDANVKCIDSDAGYRASSRYPNKVLVDGTADAVPARYLKILFTATNNNRAVVFNEIEINDGEYVPINDPAFTTSHAEARGHAPENMFDGDLSTSYKADTDQAGFVEYEFSGNEAFNRFNIIQTGGISNAQVELYVLNNGNREWVSAGVLNKSLTQLYNNSERILKIRISWQDGMVPTISEIITFQGEEITNPGNTDGIKALLAQIEALNADDYTKASWNTLQAEVVKARALLKLDSISAESAAAQEQALRNAMNALVKTANKTELKALIAACEELNQDEYTEETWSVLADALLLARLIDADEEAAQQDVDTIVTALHTARARLEKKAAPITREDLLALIARAEGYDAADYTEQSFKILTICLNVARNIAANDKSSAADIKTAYENLDEAINTLVKVKADANKVLLNMAIAYAQALDESVFDYLNELARNEFDAALTEAIAISADESATQEVVDASWKRLAKAIHMLSFTSNKAGLNALIAQAEAIEADLDSYDEAGKDAFLAALAHARDIAASDTALDPSIAEAAENLAAAMNALHKSDFDTTLLAFLVDAVKEAKEADYTPSSWSAFAASLEAAKAVLAAPESQEQIDAAVGDLHANWLDLRRRPSEDLLAELNEFLEIVRSLDPAKYTSEFLGEVMELYNRIESGMINPDFEHTEAEIMSNQANDLKERIKNPTADILAAKPLPDVSKPQKIDPIGTPSAEEVKAAEEAKKADANQSAQSVKTSANAGLGLFASLMAASAAGLEAMRRRKNRTN